MNFMIATVEGEVVNLETSPVEDHVLWPENGLITHTNHYLQQGMKFRDLKPFRTLYLSTYLRLRRVQQELAVSNSNIDEETIRRILSDHMDRPFSVCAHENPAVARPLRGVTCLSVIMNLTQKQIDYCLGNPCRGEFKTIECD